MAIRSALCIERFPAPSPGSVRDGVVAPASARVEVTR
jgi:hypothetical protein